MCRKIPNMKSSSNIKIVKIWYLIVLTISSFRVQILGWKDKKPYSGKNHNSNRSKEQNAKSYDHVVICNRRNTWYLLLTNKFFKVTHTMKPNKISL